MENNQDVHEKDIQRRLLETASEVFPDEEDLTVTSTKDEVIGWDSLGSLNLLMALEQEFGVEFSEQELENVDSMETLFEILVEKT